MDEIPSPHRKLKYVVALLRGKLSQRSYAEVRTLVHDMFNVRMSDASHTRDVDDRNHRSQPTVQIRGYKIFWLQKQLTLRFDRHFEGLVLHCHGKDLTFIGPQAETGPS